MSDNPRIFLEKATETHITIPEDGFVYGGSGSGASKVLQIQMIGLTESAQEWTNLNSVRVWQRASEAQENPLEYRNVDTIDWEDKYTFAMDNATVEIQNRNNLNDCQVVFKENTVSGLTETWPNVTTGDSLQINYKYHLSSDSHTLNFFPSFGTISNGFSGGTATYKKTDKSLYSNQSESWLRKAQTDPYSIKSIVTPSSVTGNTTPWIRLEDIDSNGLSLNITPNTSGTDRSCKIEYICDFSESGVTFNTADFSLVSINLTQLGKKTISGKFKIASGLTDFTNVLYPVEVQYSTTGDTTSWGELTGATTSLSELSLPNNTDVLNIDFNTDDTPLGTELGSNKRRLCATMCFVEKLNEYTDDDFDKIEFKTVDFSSNDSDILKPFFNLEGDTIICTIIFHSLYCYGTDNSLTKWRDEAFLRDELKKFKNMQWASRPILFIPIMYEYTVSAQYFNFYLNNVQNRYLDDDSSKSEFIFDGKAITNIMTSDKRICGNFAQIFTSETETLVEESAIMTGGKYYTSEVLEKALSITSTVRGLNNDTKNEYSITYSPMIIRNNHAVSWDVELLDQINYILVMVRTQTTSDGYTIRQIQNSNNTYTDNRFNVFLKSLSTDETAEKRTIAQLTVNFTA